MKPIIIGIDPGKEGGIAVLNCQTNNLLVLKMPPTPKDILNALKPFAGISNIMCVLEKVQGLPGMGGSPMFNFGKSFGWLEMALLSLEITTEQVTPQVWQKEFQLGTKGKQTTTVWKNKLKAKAQSLFPKNTFYLWGSDAALIAEYGKRKFKGK